MNGETIAMIKALQVKSIEELKTSGGSSDAGKVLTVGSDGKLLPAELEVGEGQIALDRTLSVSGAAADAKVVGDAITSLNGSLGTKLNTTIVIGEYIAIASGKALSSPKYARTGLLAGHDNIVLVSLNSATYEFCVLYYEATANLTNGAGYIGNSGYISGLQGIPDTAVKIALSFKRKDQEVLTDSDAEAIASSLTCILNINEKIEDFEDDANRQLINTTETTVNNIVFGSRVDSTGAYITATSGKYCRTGRRKMPSAGAVVTAKEGYRIKVFYYANDTDATSAAYLGISESYTDGTITMPPSYPYYVILVASDDPIDTTLTPSDFFTVVDKKYRVDELEGKVDTVIGERKGYSSGNIYFDVDVERPLYFGTSEATETVSIECVMRLPNTYTMSGKPTRMILMAHGAHGYIDSANNVWYNSNWIDLIEDITAAGFGVFDCNILPTSAGTESCGYAKGSALYVQVIKAAYDYIQRFYNVHKEILVHGTSMGGSGASAFAAAYPQLVLAQSSYAGRNMLRYLHTMGDSQISEKFAVAHGYESYSALIADKFSHIGEFTDLGLLKVVDGNIVYPPDRDTDFSNWITYYSDIANIARGGTVPTLIARRHVPYLAFNSWEDDAEYTQLEETLKKAYTANGSIYITKAYESGTHTDMSYGLVGTMREELIAWFKRWG